MASGIAFKKAGSKHDLGYSGYEVVHMFRPVCEAEVSEALCDRPPHVETASPHASVAC